MTSFRSIAGLLLVVVALGACTSTGTRRPAGAAAPSSTPVDVRTAAVPPSAVPPLPAPPRGAAAPAAPGGGPRAPARADPAPTRSRRPGRPHAAGSCPLAQHRV